MALRKSYPYSRLMARDEALSRDARMRLALLLVLAVAALLLSNFFSWVEKRSDAARPGGQEIPQRLGHR